MYTIFIYGDRNKRSTKPRSRSASRAAISRRNLSICRARSFDTFRIELWVRETFGLKKGSATMTQATIPSTIPKITAIRCAIPPRKFFCKTPLCTLVRLWLVGYHADDRARTRSGHKAINVPITKSGPAIHIQSTRGFT